MTTNNFPNTFYSTKLPNCLNRNCMYNMSVFLSPTVMQIFFTSSVTGASVLHPPRFDISAVLVIKAWVK